MTVTRADIEAALGPCDEAARMGSPSGMGECWRIVQSRFEDGKIAEDWAARDTMEIPRQLGVWRTLLLLVQHRKLLRNRR